MVSPKTKTEIKRYYDALAEQKLDIHKYSGQLFDVVFEIFSANTFIAGIAQQIIDGVTVPQEERIVVRDQLVSEGHWWRCDDGQLFDLRPYPEVQNLAMTIETLRAKCKTVF